MGLIEMEKNYLVDTSVLYAIFVNSDRLYDKARKLMVEVAKKEDAILMIHPLVLLEVLSLIKYRGGLSGEKIVRKELYNSKKYKILEIPIIVDEKIIKMFEKYPEIGVVDTELIEYCLENKIELMTFDKNMEMVWEKLKRKN